MVATLPLWPVLWLETYHCGPFCGCKVTVMGRFMVGNLPLWPVFLLINYNCCPFLVVKLPLRSVLWMESYPFGTFFDKSRVYPFYCWQANIMARFMVGKLLLSLVLRLTNILGPVIFIAGILPLWPIYSGKLKLGPVLWLESFCYGPFYGWKLPLWPVSSLVSYHYSPFMVSSLPLCPFYGCKITIVAPFMVGSLPSWPVL